ncbi:MAG: M12 family metallo-peptidase [Planctomycetota bacterium]
MPRMHATLCLVMLLLAATSGLATPQIRLLRTADQAANLGVIRIDADALRTARNMPPDEAFAVPGVWIGGQSLDLVLERMPLLAPDAVVVAAGPAGHEAPIDIGEVAIWRGRVEGVPGSHVFLSIADGSTVGRIELGAGRPAYAVSSVGGDPKAGGVALAAGEVAVFRTRVAGGLATPTLCGAAFPRLGLRDAAAANGPTPPPPPPPPVRGLHRARLAVECDFRFFELFGDARETAVYLIQVYGMVTDVTSRDLGVRLDLVYLRVWTTPDDPYSGGAGMPRDFPGVDYDIGQLMSGDKNARAGGAARLCGRDSWVAYGLGILPDPTNPTAFNQDFRIAAHEVGHNLGARHTHDEGVDACDDPLSTPRRGTLMSYCSQTFSGGSALTQGYFHTGVRQRVFDCNPLRLSLDCNNNFVPDADDIAAGTSADANANGVPDECEDCNANGTLDDADIAAGTSLDLNTNGVPDECEPDCNANGVPDEMDIRFAFSRDENGNAIPDECDADCNANGAADHAEINQNMALDIDRDGVLDECQDCDGDGIIDIDALGFAHNAWVAGSGDGLIKQYQYQTGVLRAEAGGGILDDPTDVLITSDGRVLVASAGDARVVEFDAAGGLVGELVAGGAGGLAYPTALHLARDGSLLVADREANAIRRYDPATGVPLGDFVPPNAAGLHMPHGMATGPDGNLFVTGEHIGVMEFDGGTGAFVGQFVEHGSGDLHHGRGMLFLPQGNGTHLLLVAENEANAILAFDGDTGAFLGLWHDGGDRWLVHPWGLRRGPDGDVYVSINRMHGRMPGGPTSGLHLTFPHLLRYDDRNGKLMFTYVQGVDARLDHPRGFDFVPGDATDCNLNRIPDSCDIAGGRSTDRNANGVPDECEALCYADCDGNGELELFDFLCFQNAFHDGDPAADCDGSGSLDLFDLLCFQNAFQDGCP